MTLLMTVYGYKLYRTDREIYVSGVAFYVHVYVQEHIPLVLQKDISTDIELIDSPSIQQACWLLLQAISSDVIKYAKTLDIVTNKIKAIFLLSDFNIDCFVF